MNRRPLPQRRPHEVIAFRHGNLSVKGGLGFYDDGALAEVFLNAARAGSDFDINARDAAIAASLALQYGCPLGQLQKSLGRNQDGSAAGVLGALLDRAARGE